MPQPGGTESYRQEAPGVGYAHNGTPPMMPAAANVSGAYFGGGIGAYNATAAPQYGSTQQGPSAPAMQPPPPPRQQQPQQAQYVQQQAQPVYSLQQQQQQPTQMHGGQYATPYQQQQPQPQPQQLPVASNQPLGGAATQGASGSTTPTLVTMGGQYYLQHADGTLQPVQVVFQDGGQGASATAPSAASTAPAMYGSGFLPTQQSQPQQQVPTAPVGGFDSSGNVGMPQGGMLQGLQPQPIAGTAPTMQPVLGGFVGAPSYDYPGQQLFQQPQEQQQVTYGQQVGSL